MIPQILCNSEIAIAAQTWEVNYYINETSGGLNMQRIQAFQSNTITNVNGENPVDGVSDPDDNGVW